MDRNARANLKKALNWIKQGRIDKARPVLAALLRRDAHNEQAWFLLSYTIDDPQRQEFALLQALRANPEFRRAQERLGKLRAGAFPTGARAIPEEKASAPEQPIEDLAAAQVEPLGDTEVLAGEVEPAERARASSRRLLRSLLLLVAIGFLGFLATQPFPFPASVAQPSAMPFASATLKATFTPTLGATQAHTSTATAEINAPPVDPETLAQMQGIQQQVGALRGLGASQEVTNALVPESSAAIAFAAVYFEPSDAGQLEGEEHVLRALGLLSASDILVDYDLDRHVDPQGGYYVSGQNRIFLVGETFSGQLPYVYAGLFARVLISQNYPAVQAVTEECSILSDSCRAVRALVGGDIALLGLQWLGTQASEELAVAVENRPDVPLLFHGKPPAEFALLDLAFPAERGVSFIQTVFDLGGWGEVNSLYSNLPLSSEQILHPEKYLTGEAPVMVIDPGFGPVFGSAWVSLGSGTLGEWLTTQVLASGVQPETRLPGDLAGAAAAGWGGDLFQAYLRERDGAVALAAHWVMDGAEDATELAAALANYLGLRFAEAASRVGSGACWAGDGRRACLYADGAEVLWLLGPDEIVVIQVMLAHYPQLQ